ncbi:MAG: hypothetical protein ACLFSB_00875 [Chitinispirillaceae bacterium]
MAKDRKKKRKKSPKIPHKILIAQKRNEYMRRYVRVVKAIGALDVYRSLPEKELHLLWLARVPTLRVEAAEGAGINPRLLNVFRVCISEMVKKFEVSVVKDGPKVTMEDYFTAGVALGSYARTIDTQNAPGVDRERVKQAFNPLARHDRYDEPYRYLGIIGGFLARYFSRPNSKIYSTKQGLCRTKNLPADALYFDVMAAEKISVTSNGKKRTCFRLCWPDIFGRINYAKVRAQELGIESPLSELSLDVYIQTHALIRMRERIDVGDTPTLLMFFYDSIDRKAINPVRPGVGLLEYWFYDTLVGYFLIEAIEGVALVKTFLFVTNTGTPQGDKLDAALGAGKLDKQYLLLDRLSTFIKTDVMQSEGLRKALREAGGESLLKMADLDLGNQKTGYASFVDRYLGFADRHISPRKDILSYCATAGTENSSHPDSAPQRTCALS